MRLVRLVLAVAGFVAVGSCSEGRISPLNDANSDGFLELSDLFEVQGGDSLGETEMGDPEAVQTDLAEADLPEAGQADPDHVAIVGYVRTMVELNLGESQTVTLSNGETAMIELIDKSATRDSIRNAVRKVKVTIQINGTKTDLWSGNYSLPVSVGGVQIDCPVTCDYYDDASEDRWRLSKDARFRLWPADSLWMPSGSFGFPLNMRILASDTQVGNEPTFVNGDESSSGGSIYYHYGVDLGGSDGMEDVLTTTDGTVVDASGNTIGIRDAQGWIHYYDHLKGLVVSSGQKVTTGQKIGILGGAAGESGSGGWSHLHYSVYVNGASEYAYPYLWEAYVMSRQPKVIAVARPHYLAKVGEAVTLDGSRSKSFSGNINSFDWTFTDGGKAAGETTTKTYDRVGTFSETLKVTDSQGNKAYDFEVVQIIGDDGSLPHTIHANFTPTMDVKTGQPLTFKAKIFRTGETTKEWDFGDGSEKSTSTGSDYDTMTHTYKSAGDFIVTVRETTDSALTYAKLWVRVDNGR